MKYINLLLLWFSSSSLDGQDKTIEVIVKSDRIGGIIHFAAYTDERNFLDDKLSAMNSSIAFERDSVVFVLPKSLDKVAITVFHDVNKNEKLDTNFFGLPIEPYGFSKDARGLLGPPDFNQCLIDLNNVDRLTIHLR